MNAWEGKDGTLTPYFAAKPFKGRIFQILWVNAVGIQALEVSATIHTAIAQDHCVFAKGIIFAFSTIAIFATLACSPVDRFSIFRLHLCLCHRGNFCYEQQEPDPLELGRFA